MQDTTINDLRRADAIRLRKVGTWDVIKLWGQESLACITYDLDAPPRCEYIIDKEYESDAQLLGWMYRVVEAKGRLPREVQHKFELLQQEAMVRMWKELNEYQPTKC